MQCLDSTMLFKIYSGFPKLKLQKKGLKMLSVSVKMDSPFLFETLE